MARRSFFGRLSTLGGEVTSFVDLEYSKDNKDVNKKDISTIDIEDQDFKTPSLHLQKGPIPEIPLIGIGGAGLRLLDKIVLRLNSYGMEYPTLGIDSDVDDLKRYNNISHKLEVPGSTTGSGHQFRVAAGKAVEAEEKIKQSISTYIQDLKMRHTHEIVFILLGSGGTGVGIGIEVARMLIELGKRPVPFVILPTRDEMTRIKFNAAAALYHFSLAPRDRCLNLTTICIDNERFMAKNSRKHYSSVVSASNERIASTLGDIIATTELESHAFSADLNEFLEIFRDLKSLGTLQYFQIEKSGEEIGKLFDKNLDDSLSMDFDIFQATRSYFYISSTPKQLMAEDYRNLLLKFENSDMFSKLYEISSEEEFVAIRAIYTGLRSTPYIEELMEMAAHVKVEILENEIDQNRSGKQNTKLDRLQNGDKIDVKTGEELRDSNREDFAKIQREGDH